MVVQVGWLDHCASGTFTDGPLSSFLIKDAQEDLQSARLKA